MEDHHTLGRLLAWPAVRERVGISRTTAWRLQNSGMFPLPVVISAGRVGWREEDIAAWTASLTKRKLTGPTAAADAAAVEAPGSSKAPAAEPGAPLRFARQRRQSSSGAEQLGFDF